MSVIKDDTDDLYYLGIGSLRCFGEDLLGNLWF